MKAIINQLLEKNKRLGTENTKLRRRFRRGRTNCHKPPSSDGYVKQTSKPGIPKDKYTKGGPKGQQ